MDAGELEQTFNEKAEAIRGWEPSEQPSQDEKLVLYLFFRLLFRSSLFPPFLLLCFKKLYGLFKQATVGDCNTDKPGLFSGFEAGYKWSAWDSYRGLSSEEAMQQYIEEVDRQMSSYA